MIKKLVLIFAVLSIFSVSTIVAEENTDTEKEEDSITSLYLRTGLSFVYFTINGNKYYSYYDSDYAPTIVEVITVDKDLYKLVYAEPMNKAGAQRYVTIYLETGDIVGLKLPYSDTVAGGIVVTGKPNVIELKGMMK